jgi:purine-binding chemotaxis protein CheW
MSRSNGYSSSEVARILKERAESVALVKEQDAQVDEQFSVIEFELGMERYAIDTLLLKEVLITRKIYDLPGTPGYILGVINLRGIIVTVIDLKEFLQLKYKGINDSTSIVVVESHGNAVGFVVDRINGIKNIGLEITERSKPKFQHIKEEYLMGVTGETVVVLDALRLLDDQRMLVNENGI